MVETNKDPLDMLKTMNGVIMSYLGFSSYLKYSRIEIVYWFVLE